MKTVFDQNTRDEIIGRINSLDEKNIAQWGKMNVYQMIKHCTLADEMFLGRQKYPRTFISFLIGKLVLKRIMQDEKRIGRNAPTAPGFRVSETTGDVPAEKTKWTGLIQEYENYKNPKFVHWFFGKMTKEQVGQFAYIHSDHHLKQFGC